MYYFIFFLPFVLWFLTDPFLKIMIRAQKLPFIPMDFFAVYFFVGIHIFSTTCLGQSHLIYYILLLAILGIALGWLYTYRLNRPIKTKYFVQLWRLADMISLLAFVFYGLALLITG